LLDPPTGRLRFVDAGHGHAFIARRDGAVESLTPSCAPIGLAFGEGVVGGETALDLGDRLVLYSDGLLDAGPRPNLEPASLARAIDGARTADEAAERLVALPTLIGPPIDDLTVLVLMRHAAP
jgi:serine phosphatase RsbU (regulator of sigma subunit)